MTTDTTPLEIKANELEKKIWEAHPYRKSMKEIIVEAITEVHTEAYSEGYIQGEQDVSEN